MSAGEAHTPKLTRCGSLPVEYVHPLAMDAPTELSPCHDDPEIDVVRQLTTRMPYTLPLKKHVTLNIDSLDISEVQAPPAELLASFEELGVRKSIQGSESSKMEEHGTLHDNLQRSHRFTSASTTSVNSSQHSLVSIPSRQNSTESSKSAKQTPMSADDLAMGVTTCMDSTASSPGRTGLLTQSSIDGLTPCDIVDRILTPPIVSPLETPRREEQEGIVSETAPNVRVSPPAEPEEPMETVEEESAKFKEQQVTEEQQMDVIDDPNTHQEDIIPSTPMPNVFDPSMRPIDIVFSFDTTGSMSRCIEEVQSQLKEIIQRLFMDVPNLNIGIIAHGDYCDAEHFYVTKILQPNNDLNAIASFVNDVTGTGGGDWPECYELVLNKMRTEMKWRDWGQRALVMVGDAVPHEAADNPGNINWRDEAKYLYSQMNVRIYSVQCLADTNPEATKFWKDLAEYGDGKHLSMNNFSTIVDLVMAVVYREFAPDALLAYEKEVRARQPITKDLNHMFAKLRDGEIDVVSSTVSDDTPSTSAPAPILTNKRLINKVPVRKTITSASAKQRGPTGTQIKKTGATRKARPKGKPRTVRTKMVLRPKKYVPPATLNMQLRSSMHRRGISHCSLDNSNKMVMRETKNTSQQVIDVHPTTRTVRVCREFVTSSRLLNQLKWTPWFLAMKGAMDISTGDPTLATFSIDKEKAAMYEIAVQTTAVEGKGVKGNPKKHVMHFKITRGIPYGRSWDRYIFSGKVLGKQIQNVLDQDISVFIRRALLPNTIYSVRGKAVRSVEKVREEVKKHISYAWSSNVPQTNSCRYIKREGKVISS